MSSQSLQVIVDDSVGDTSLLSYTGKWRLGTHRSRAREHDTTIHCTTSQEASATFNFYGSSVLLAGTQYGGNTTANISYSLDSSTPISKQSIGTPGQLKVRETWLEEPNLSNGLHSLTAALVNEGGYFCVDYFLHKTTLKDVLEQKKPVTVFVDDSDASGNLTYSDSWTPRNGLETMYGTDHFTRKLGSYATFEFYGTFVAVYGNAFPGNPITIAYSLDGGTAVQATDTVRLSPTFGRRLFFLDNIQDGYHKLVFTLQNDADFSLDYITYRPSLTEAIYGTGPSPSPSPSIPNSRTTNTGVIAGGVIGGVMGLIAILAAVLFYFKLRQRQRYTQPQPFMLQPWVIQPTQPRSFSVYPSSRASSYPLSSGSGSAYRPL